LLTIVSEHGLQDDIDRYKANAEVCNCFTFAEQEGVAVALQPGDILLFNPVYEHCLLSRTSAYETKDMFSLSMYLKTAIVGTNDNSLPLTEIENHLLW
jgi:ectoine hydroxylase-related dioxygenase (phytanoyl-CoA dioxygenase family)